MVWRRGRSENKLDRHLDEKLIRRLPLGALALLVLTLLYAGWSRPDWTSEGRLPGNATFGGIALVQGLLVIALAVVARVLYRTAPDPRTALRGFAGPAVAMLACALGGVMSEAAPSASPTGSTARGSPAPAAPSTARPYS